MLSPIPLLYSFSTLGCPDASWEDAVAIARKHGFSAIELRALKGSVDLPAVLRDTFREPDRMAEAVLEAGLNIASLDASLQLLSADDGGWQEIADLAPWADRVGVPFLRVFDGHGDGLDPQTRAGLRSAFARWRSMKEERGFCCDLMVETHWALADAEACVRLGREMRDEGNDLHLLWDSCHTWNLSGLDPEAGWEILRPWVRHIHIKDGVKDGGKLRYVVPGEGEIPVTRLLAALRRDGFAGPVSLEWELMWHCDLAPLEQALESGRRHGWW